MADQSDRQNHLDGSHQQDNQQDKSQTPQPQRPRPQPRRSSTGTSVGSSVIEHMRADPKTADQLQKIMSQLDPDGQADLADLASHVAAGARRKGRVDNDTYREQNPWHDTPREKPVFSLGEPLPRPGDDYQEKNPWHGKMREQPVFSLGEPLPHKVRRARQAKKDKQQQEEDVEQGMRRRPTAGSQQPPQQYATTEPDHSDDTLQDAPRLQEGEAHKTDTDQGTDMAKKFQIDSDRIGGQREDDAVEDGDVDINTMRNYWARLRAKYPEPLAEFFCTGMSVFLGMAGTLSVNLSQDQTKQYGTWETLCWAWGLSFMFGIYLGGGVSGAHMNPVISLSLAIYRGFPWRRCGLYIVIQVLAAFVGTMLAYGLFRDAILQVDPDLTQTYSSWFTVPQPWVSPATAFFNEFIGGAILMIAVLSLGDDQNNPPGAGMHAFIIGLLVTILKMTLGYNTGAALSPANDFAARVVAQIVGYRTPHLWQTGWFAYGPIAGTLTGALVGCAMYDLVVFVGSESPINYRWSKEKHIARTFFHKRK